MICRQPHVSRAASPVGGLAWFRCACWSLRWYLAFGSPGGEVAFAHGVVEIEERGDCQRREPLGSDGCGDLGLWRVRLERPGTPSDVALDCLRVPAVLHVGGVQSVGARSPVGDLALDVAGGVLAGAAAAAGHRGSDVEDVRPRTADRCSDGPQRHRRRLRGDDSCLSILTSRSATQRHPSPSAASTRHEWDTP